MAHIADIDHELCGSDFPNAVHDTHSVMYGETEYSRSPVKRPPLCLIYNGFRMETEMPYSLRQTQQLNMAIRFYSLLVRTPE